MMTIEILVVAGFAALGVTFLALAFVGNLPSADRFIVVNALDGSEPTRSRVQSVLDRGRKARRRGALAGLALGVALGLGTSTGFGFYSAVLGLLAGTLAGIAGSAVPRDDGEEPSTAKRALLAPRDPDDYRPVHFRATTFVLGLAILGATTIAIVTAPHGLGVTFVLFVFAVATIAAIPLARSAQRRTIEARRSDADPAAVRVDDALRGCTVRAIHHATLGLLWCGLLLAAYGLVTTQAVTEVIVDDRVAFELPPLTGSTSVVATPLVQATPDRWTLKWTPPSNAPQTRVIRGRSVILETTGSVWLIGLGSWITLAALGGALYQYGRAAKASRRPQRTPSVETRPMPPQDATA